MLDAPTANGTSVARMACLLAVAPVLGLALLVLSGQEPNFWFGALLAILTAIILRAVVTLPRGDAAVFTLLWLALGLTLGLVLLGAFSFGVALLMTLMMLILAIATAPNRTGRSRAYWPYVLIQALAFFAVLSLPFAFG